MKKLKQWLKKFLAVLESEEAKEDEDSQENEEHREVFIWTSYALQ